MATIFKKWCIGSAKGACSLMISMASLALSILGALYDDFVVVIHFCFYWLRTSVLQLAAWVMGLLRVGAMICDLILSRLIAGIELLIAALTLLAILVAVDLPKRLMLALVCAALWLKWASIQLAFFLIKLGRSVLNATLYFFQISVRCIKRGFIFLLIDFPGILKGIVMMMLNALKVMINAVKNTLRGQNLNVALYWLRCLGPVTMIFIVGIIFFAQDIVDSIVSTPHPGLVYTIFAMFFGGVLYCANILRLYVKDEAVIAGWAKLNSSQDRSVYVNSLANKEILVPVLELLNSNEAASPSLRHAAIEGKIDGIERAMIDRLNLPNYIAGALVGVGLIGTFIGLLGTLADLGILFESLGGSANANADAAELFGNMVQRLQAPMRGMGTAFVASLYGLLGSLILGLMVLSVKNVAVGIVEGLRDLAHEFGYDATGSSTVNASLDFSQMLAEFRGVRDELSSLNKNIEALVAKFQQ